jgi:hypothetical protein
MTQTSLKQWRRAVKHRFLLSAVATMAIIGGAAPAGAQRLGQYPWCSQYQDRSAARSCSYDTQAQCMQTVSGIGGYCFANPNYVYPAGPRRVRRH